jgi:hypothetical protein
MCKPSVEEMIKNYTGFPYPYHFGKEKGTASSMWNCRQVEGTRT